MATALDGSGDWLFLSNDTNRVIDQITGHYKLDVETERAWRETFQYRSEKARSLQFHYCFSVAPNKECVYGDRLPNGIVVSPLRPIHTVLDSARSANVASVYHLDALINARTVSETYPPGDTHWTGWGALIAFNSLMLALDLPTLNFDRLTLQSHLIEGDLSGKRGRNTATTKIIIIKPDFSIIEDNKITNIGNLIVFTNSNQALPTAVVFRDSFTTFQLNLFASSFRRVVLVWQPNIDYTIIENERPDFVVSQHSERFLIRCPNDFSGKTNSQYVADKQ